MSFAGWLCRKMKTPGLGSGSSDVSRTRGFAVSLSSVLLHRGLTTDDNRAAADKDAGDDGNGRAAQHLADGIADVVDSVPDPVHGTAEPAAAGDFIELVDREFEVRAVFLDLMSHVVSPV